MKADQHHRSCLSGAVQRSKGEILSYLSSFFFCKSFFFIQSSHAYSSRLRSLGLVGFYATRGHPCVSRTIPSLSVHRLPSSSWVALSSSTSFSCRVSYEAHRRRSRSIDLK
ncbi:hypothetical protein Y032_0058g2863 [Ancylostoma ceylanicum]|uniref:Uncharacterized protein n=1 Tax=Ancylostoma ceylanicum TaxID=53326 RepID=A0A016U4G5_9BILA|nr:hypothetical protein Y032_0058g2863 [Ancylostoma ceylanicum]